MIRKTINILGQFVSRSVVAACVAALITVSIGAFAASKLPKGQRADSPVERVVQAAVSGHVERIAVTPKLSVNPPPKAPPQGVSAGAAAGVPGPAAPSTTSPAAPQIARTAKVSLFVSNVESAVKSLSQVARRQNGDVFSLQVDNQGSNTQKASAAMDIRVPAIRFDAAMSAVGEIGKVRERSVTAEDLTADITDSAARLRNLRRTESDIRKIMDRSGTVGQVLEAENQLSQVREQIETLESDLKSMRGRVAYSTISISVEAETSNAPVEPTAASQLATAWRSALHALSQLTVGLIAVLLWTVAFAPYVLAAALAVIIYRRWRTGGRAGA